MRRDVWKASFGKIEGEAMTRQMEALRGDPA
jgi:hypothetical protein